ncbi:hypothetical protein CSKR_102422 [Clonorchis sinensis]|uniref:Uncharacterized protein n=1 Tax=Clonorchis sinensis TaxID=79923 RepID=A0A8T1LWS0_CLOSI|nr:hypothetical protein CSKR_102422 [Clonorchis sinensis]
MDPLVPKFSPYELDYTTDIQQKMRVPDKISYNSDKSIIATEDEPIALRNYKVADLVLDVNNPSVKSPGFSPDLLNNSDVRGPTFARANAAAESFGRDARAAATAHAMSVSSHLVSDSPTTVSAKSSNKRLESQLSDLQKRVASLEFQQGLIGTELMDASTDQLYEFFKPLNETDVALRKSFYKRLLVAATCFGIASVVCLILGVSLMGVYESKRYSDVTSSGLFAFGCAAFSFCLPTFVIAGLLIKALVVTKSANDEARRQRQFRVDELLTVDYPKMPSRILTPPPEYEPAGAANEPTIRVVITRGNAESDAERECEQIPPPPGYYDALRLRFFRCYVDLRTVCSPRVES